MAQATFGPSGATLCEPQFIAQRNEQRQETVRPAAAQPAMQATVAPPAAAASAASHPQWRAAHLPSMVPHGLLNAIISTWNVGGYADIGCPDGQLRRFQHQGARITATDVMNMTTVIAELY